MSATAVRPKTGLIFTHVKVEGTFKVTKVESEFTTYGRLNEYGVVDKLGYGGRRRRVRTERFPEIVSEVLGQGSLKAREDAGPKLSAAEFESLFARAHDTGMTAGQAARPEPMLVVQRENPFDDSSRIIREYAPVMDGVCGFAWIVVRPGNGHFARWARKTGRGSSAYGGGLQIRAKGFGQSLERKEAYAQAFAEVLREAGIKAFAESRMD